MKKKFKVLIACALSAATVASLVACGNDGEPARYTVKFDTMGGSLVASYSRKAGETINRPTMIPTKDKFVFDDWYTDTTYTTKFTFDVEMPANDLVVYAGWVGEKSVILTLDANGGEFEDKTTTVQEIGVVGSAIPELDSPEYYGYRFGGWYTDKDCTAKFTFRSFPTTNATLYAGWEADDEFAYVSYYGNGSLIETVPVKKGETIAKYELDDDLVASDWYTDAEMTSKYSFGAATENVSLYSNYYTRGLEFTDGAVTGYNGKATEIVVPSVYNGVTITSIGKYAFNRSTELEGIKSVKIPNTVETIDEGAFYECRYLTDVTLTDKVKTIGKNAFYKNTRLKNLGDISSVTEINAAAFAGCENLRTIALPATLATLGEYAFADCKLLESVTVPGKIQSVLKHTFGGCKALKSVAFETLLPVTFANDSFVDCPALENITINSVLVAQIAATGAIVSPFPDSSNIKIYVPASMVESYRSRYGHLDNNSLKDKFVAIGQTNG